MENINDKIFEKSYNSFDSNLSLIERANNMIEFAHLVRTVKNRGRYINDFYMRSMEVGFMDYLQYNISIHFFNEEKKRFFIYDDFGALKKYIYLSLALLREKPLKTLENIEKFATVILKNLEIKKNNNIIKVEEIEEIMDYLDKKYNFIEKIYKDFIPTFSIIESENPLYNSFSQIGLNIKNELNYHYVLFNVKENCSPIYVFLHEIGHTIHSYMTGLKLYIPKEILDKLEKTGFKGIDTADEYEKREAIADIFAMGLMYDSPYAKLDPFIAISKEDKAIFNEIIKDIFSKEENK